MQQIILMIVLSYDW